MKINTFLIKTIESIGKYESLEEDLVDYLLDVFKTRILIENEKTLMMSDPNNPNKELKNESENLLNLFLKLTILKSKYSETRKHIARLEQQSLKFSAILSNILDVPSNETQQRLEELKMYNESMGIFNNYDEIREILFKDDHLNNDNR